MNTLESEVYLNIAREYSRLSKDADTKVGAVIIASDGTQISSGRNGPPSGMNDDKIPLSREMSELSYIEDGNLVEFSSNKYPFMRHAERNAIAFANSRGQTEKLKSATIYVTHLPCPDCASDIAHYGISKVVVDDNIKHDLNSSVSNSYNNYVTKYIFSQKDIKLYIGTKLIELYGKE
jgi:dCMP deaminase